MQTRPDLQIKSILKAMNDVVLPAVPDVRIAVSRAASAVALSPASVNAVRAFWPSTSQ